MLRMLGGGGAHWVLRMLGWGRSPLGAEDAGWGRSHRVLGNPGIDGDPQGSGNIMDGVESTGARVESTGARDFPKGYSLLEAGAQRQAAGSTGDRDNGCPSQPAGVR